MSQEETWPKECTSSKNAERDNQQDVHGEQHHYWRRHPKAKGSQSRKRSNELCQSETKHRSADQSDQQRKQNAKGFHKPYTVLSLSSRSDSCRFPAHDLLNCWRLPPSLSHHLSIRTSSTTIP